jgi:hypothetical protein
MSCLVSEQQLVSLGIILIDTEIDVRKNKTACFVMNVHLFVFFLLLILNEGCVGLEQSHAGC